MGFLIDQWQALVAVAAPLVILLLRFVWKRQGAADEKARQAQEELEDYKRTTKGIDNAVDAARRVGAYDWLREYQDRRKR